MLNLSSLHRIKGNIRYGHSLSEVSAGVKNAGGSWPARPSCRLLRLQSPYTADPSELQGPGRRSKAHTMKLQRISSAFPFLSRSRADSQLTILKGGAGWFLKSNQDTYISKEEFL